MQPNNPDPSGANLIPTLVVLVFELAIAIIVIAGMWKTFEKAGKPGWASIVPIYNIIVLLEIADKPIWWVVLYLIPCVNIVVSILVMIELAQKFGQGAGFAFGLIFLPFIFFPILGFGDSRYRRRRVAAIED